MRHITANTGHTIPLGRRGENQATEVSFDVSAWLKDYPTGEIRLIAQRQGDAYPYPIDCVRQGDTVVWTVSNADSGVEGFGACELQLWAGEMLMKSRPFATYTATALEDPDEVPEPMEGYLKRIQEIGARVEAASQHAPKIGENGNWWLWDTVNGLFVDSGFSANGLVGPQGERGPQGYSGGATIEPTQEEDGFYVNDITGGGSTTGDPNKITAPENPSAGQFLVYNGTAWVAQTLTEWQGGSY